MSEKLVLQVMELGEPDAVRQEKAWRQAEGKTETIADGQL